MIDLDQALEEQSDLDALCAKRKGFESPEKHLPNEGYGFAQAMKLYAGYPLDQPINAVVPHGVYLNAETMLPDELNAPVPAVLNYPAFRAGVWQRETDRTIVPAASPFLYALELFRSEFPGSPGDPRGTIFYPGHIVSRVRTNTLWSDLAKELASLDEKYQPVTVCMYYVDFWAGNHKPFLKLGIPVVSAGNHADREFIYRWLHLLSQHRYAATNCTGSSIYYASKAGKPVFLASQMIRHSAAPIMTAVGPGGASSQVMRTKKAVEEAFRGDPDQPSAERDGIVDYMLGQENFKTPDGLLADLEYVAGLGK